MKSIRLSAVYCPGIAKMIHIVGAKRGIRFAFKTFRNGLIFKRISKMLQNFT